MPRHRGRQDGDDAETVTQVERRGHGAFGNAQHRPRRGLAGRMQARVGETGDHEGVGLVVLAFDQLAERVDDTVDMALGLDAGRSLGERQAVDRGPVGEAQVGHGVIDAPRHGLGRIRVDDDDTLAHGASFRFRGGGFGAHSAGGMAPVCSTMMP